MEICMSANINSMHSCLHYQVAITDGSDDNKIQHNNIACSTYMKHRTDLELFELDI